MTAPDLSALAREELGDLHVRLKRSDIVRLRGMAETLQCSISAVVKLFVESGLARLDAGEQAPYVGPKHPRSKRGRARR